MIDQFTIVVFGGAGDLAGRKLLPSIHHLFAEDELPSGFSIIGVGLPEMDDLEYRVRIEKAIKEFGEGHFDQEKWDEFSSHLFYIPGPFNEDDLYRRLYQWLDEKAIKNERGDKPVIYYMAVPPTLMPVIINKLKLHNLSRKKFNTRIIVEKPFGRDRETAVELNRFLFASFDEEQIYRIDHYLGKETVQNIIFFRFSNSIFEPLWNC